mgnify:CR=1 FL=1
MEILKDYILFALTASVMTGLAENLVNERMKVFVRFISGLFVILLLAYPILNVAISFTEELYNIPSEIELGEDSYDVTPESGIIGRFKSETERSVKEYVSLISGISGEKIDVRVDIDSSDISNIAIEMISVYIWDDCDRSAIESSVRTKYGAPVQVVISENQRNNQYEDQRNN